MFSFGRDHVLGLMLCLLVLSTTSAHASPSPAFPYQAASPTKERETSSAPGVRIPVIRTLKSLSSEASGGATSTRPARRPGELPAGGPTVPPAKSKYSLDRKSAKQVLQVIGIIVALPVILILRSLKNKKSSPSAMDSPPNSDVVARTPPTSPSR